MSIVRDMIVKAGLRPTRQRLQIGALLFDGRDKHVTAEALHDMVLTTGESVSLATVYNTLNAFRDAGLLREVSVDSGKVYFDTHITQHFHFYAPESGELTDIATDNIQVSGLPELPAGTALDRLDIIIRLKDA